jgi:hypothetical protein
MEFERENSQVKLTREIAQESGPQRETERVKVNEIISL